MTLNPVAQKITQLKLEGNIIPNSWYQHITFENGKADLLAISILADIVYWYRLVEVRDETTGRTVDWKQKFRADKLQRSYDALAQQFGVTKRQAQEAVKRLEKMKLLTKEFRNIKTTTGFMSNVLFLEPVVEQIEKITYPHQDVTPPTLERGISHIRMGDIPHQDVTPPTLERGTYTEITTETTTEITTEKKHMCVYPDEFEEFWKVYPRRIEKKKAFRNWQARIREGYSPSQLIEATKKYATKCETENTLERYIKHPATFLGPDKPFEEFLKKEEPELDGWLRYIQLQQQALERDGV
jgi:hypothetical protein